MAAHSSSWIPRALTAVGVAVALLTVAAAWADHVAGHGQRVAANVAFLETDVSRMELDEVRSLVGQRDDRVLSTEVAVDTGEAALEFTAGELGFVYETEDVVAQIMDARHDGGPARRLLDWLGSPIDDPVDVGDRVRFDPEAAETRLAGDPSIVLTEPVEPLVTMEGENHLYVVEGVPGQVVDIEDLVARLAGESPLPGPIRLRAELLEVAPTVSDDEARQVAASLNETTGDGAVIVVGSATASLGPSLLRRLVTVVATDGNLNVRFDGDGLHALLERLIPEPVTGMARPRFDVVADTPIVVEEGEPPLRCCQRESILWAAEMIMAGASGPIRVEARPVDDPNLVAWARGETVVEEVGEFTTRHSCCENRVSNIHRIADIVRGIYLLPGETVSLNEYVGRRTREKGFVAAGAIRSGHLDSEVGGGVSQFATTIFNAAFFAGLDIPVYQAHSLYFSRYPFGREATISHPAPDLVLENTTEHPVLIWTSYTGTSITVTMYSTKHVDVEVAGQRVGRWNRCTYVETDRSRTYPDGRVVVDTFEALYRPADGIDCNGNPIPRT